MNGLDFRRSISDHPKLRNELTPFVFFSTSGEANIVNETFKLSIQGYFVKCNTFSKLVTYVETVINNWKISEQSAGKTSTQVVADNRVA